MENHEIFLQCDKLFSSNLSHSAQVRFGQLEWYNIYTLLDIYIYNIMLFLLYFVYFNLHVQGPDTGQ